MTGILILTTHKLAAQASARWLRQYKIHGGYNWKSPAGKSGEEVYNQLLALGPNPDPLQVNEIIGNDSWTRLTCCQCDNSVDAVIVFNDGDDNTCNVCIDCIKESYIYLKHINTPVDI